MFAIFEAVKGLSEVQISFSFSLICCHDKNWEEGMRELSFGNLEESQEHFVG